MILGFQGSDAQVYVPSKEKSEGLRPITLSIRNRGFVYQNYLSSEEARLLATELLRAAVEADCA